jgi:hypothetical protein
LKLLLQLLVSLLLHPVAVILAWINIAGRSDLGAIQKVLWAALVLVGVALGPMLYVTIGKGSLW